MTFTPHHCDTPDRCVCQMVFGDELSREDADRLAREVTDEDLASPFLASKVYVSPRSIGGPYYVHAYLLPPVAPGR